MSWTVFRIILNTVSYCSLSFFNSCRILGRYWSLSTCWLLGLWILNWCIPRHLSGSFGDTFQGLLLNLMIASLMFRIRLNKVWYWKFLLMNSNIIILRFIPSPTWKKLSYKSHRLLLKLLTVWTVFRINLNIVWFE